MNIIQTVAVEDLTPTNSVIASSERDITEIRVNGRAIAGAKIAAEMQYHRAQDRREAMLKAAESLVIGELLRQRARALGLNVREDTVEASDDDFIEALLAYEVAIPEASEAECLQYYNAKPQRFTSSPLLEVRHILFASAPDDDERRVAGKERADCVCESLRSGADFAALAKAESACPSKVVGGSLGQISRGQTVPEFERQVFAAEAGLLPRPVESRYGFHVVFIERKVAGVQLPFDAVKETIESYLNEKVRAKAIAQYIHTLIAEAEIDGYDFGVSSSPLMQ